MNASQHCRTTGLGQRWEFQTFMPMYAVQTSQSRTQVRHLRWLNSASQGRAERTSEAPLKSLELLNAPQCCARIRGRICGNGVILSLLSLWHHGAAPHPHFQAAAEHIAQLIRG